MNDFLELLKQEKFDNQLQKMIKRYKNKKLVLYGVGKFFHTIKNNYDLSKLNIIAVSDIMFKEIETPIFDEKLGYNKISPYCINKLKPDFVLISVLKDIYIEKFFNEQLFKDKNCRFKYKVLFQPSLSYKIRLDL